MKNMIIVDPYLGTGWRIKKDEYSWNVQRYSHSHKGKEKWISTDFYENLPDAVKRIKFLEIVSSEETISLGAYVRLMNKTFEEAEDFTTKVLSKSQLKKATSGGS